MPNGRNMTIPRGHDDGRSPVLTTSESLSLGPVPERIDRPLTANNEGLIGPNVDSFPMTGGLEFMGHVPIVHVAQGVTIHPGNTIDDTAEVPAIFAGNPL